LSGRQIGYLADYVRERSSNVDRQFTNLSTLHKAAGQELQQRMAKLSDVHVRRLADDYFPRKGDGTRRSADKYFDGVLRQGDYTYGMGAFLSHEAEATPDQMRALVAAFDLIAGFGPAARRDYDNLYFFTSRPTRLVMYGPDRPDHLTFYRHDAPADMSVDEEEMAKLTLPQFDPERATRCTNLQRLVQDDSGKRLSTACLTPVYVGDRYVGAFGSSMELTHFFLNALKDTPSGATPMIITQKGELIAYPGFISNQTKSPEKTVAEYEKRFALSDLAARATATGREQGVIESKDGRQIVAFGRLSGPNWYLLLTYPKANVVASALGSASWVLLIGGVASLIQALAVVLLARSSIVRPVERLAASCEADGARVDVADVEARQDEIGVLATALRTEREKVEQVMASLEDR
ncbi:MAG: hybrid sensor histidine kinase/response regulator, partial [Proteobacteria bacterium]|nr:hybrid sensor histidine kinase/response regulator [Pseudomonadota bacterium]